MNTEEYKSLSEQLKSFETLIETFLSHKSTPYTDTYGAVTSPIGDITMDMDLESLPKEKLCLLHSMLHLFYSNKSGKGLDEKKIVILHSRLKEKLSFHKKFDRLDIDE